MPINVVCPWCGHKSRVPDAIRGRTLRCTKCGADFPAEPKAPPDAQPRPARSEPTSSDAVEGVPQVPQEPWYYRYLQTMTYVFLWVNVSGIALGLLGWIIYVIDLLRGAGHTASGWSLRYAATVGLVSLPYLAALVVWLLVALMMAGWSFLALDAARNLRVIRYTAKTR
jgi:hypothetical protein